MTALTEHKGFTLVELVIVIVLAGILATVATVKMSQSIDAARHEHTKKELDRLAMAIVGNPGIYSQGARSDFGYVGDVGALPPDLDALVANPGGYATWDGPYMSINFGSDDFKRDAWRVEYVYFDTLLRSTGSGSEIDKVFAGSRAELLANTLEGLVVDAGGDRPGTVYRDSMVIRLTYPDGSGNMSTASATPSPAGNFQFVNVPIGNHVLSAIYLPDTDTVNYHVSIAPGRTVKLSLTFPADLW